jgi:hypothetical protein
MTDPLADLFAGAREQAIRQVKPPGAAAARRVVRRRRFRSALAVSCAVLAIGGASVALAHSFATPISADPAAALGDPVGVVVADESAPVSIRYDRGIDEFLGNLSLDVACAGTGRITALVEGTPDPATGETRRVEQARVTATCGADPVRVTTRFSASDAIAGFHVRLVDAADATGNFAYRITSDTGTPMRPGDRASDARTALDMTPVARSLTLPPGEPRQAPGGPRDAGAGSVAFVCGGIGTAVIQVRTMSRVDVERRVVCQWPLRRVEVPIGPAGGDTSLWFGFETRDGDTAPAHLAWGWIK